MAIKTKLIWKKIERPWGYEVRVDFEDDGKTYNEVLTFFKDPDDKSVDLEIASRMKVVENRIAFEAIEASKLPIDPIFDAVDRKEEEIKTILIAKGLLTKGVAIADMQTKAEIIASDAVVEVIP